MIIFGALGFSNRPYSSKANTHTRSGVCGYVHDSGPPEDVLVLGSIHMTGIKDTSIRVDQVVRPDEFIPRFHLKRLLASCGEPILSRMAYKINRGFSSCALVTIHSKASVRTSSGKSFLEDLPKESCHGAVG